MMEVSKHKIKCSTFSTREKFIQELNHDIWREDLTSGELMNKAHSLLTELDILSDCPKYKQENVGCKTCKAICDLRKGSTIRLTRLMTNLPSLSKEKIMYSCSEK